MPPLRERPGDILLLAEHYLTSHSRDQIDVPKLSSKGRQALLGCHWPGNVRELLHVLERGLVHWRISGMPEMTPKMLGLSSSEEDEPLSSRTVIRFSLSENVPAELNIYDVAGKLVRKLDRGLLQAGTHEVAWDGRNDEGIQVLSGIYWSQLRVGDRTARKKMVLLR